MAISSRKLPARTSSSALASVDEPLLIAPLVLGKSRRDLPQLQAHLATRGTQGLGHADFPASFLCLRKKKTFFHQDVKGQ